MDPIRVAVAGLGDVALNRHLPVLQRSPDYRIVGVIDRHPGRAAVVADKHKLSHFAETGDLAQVDWLDDVDALTICVPPMAHAALVEAALAKGKHVLVEKPFAVTLAEGESMAAHAREHQRVLAVAHNFQFCRAAKKLFSDLAENRLGDVKHVVGAQFGNPRRHFPTWVEKLPFGLFYDESPHFFYLLRALAGGTLTLLHAHGVAATESAHATPTLVSLLYRNAANVPITINCHYASAVSEWYVLVMGDRALGILDLYRDIYIRLPNDGAHTLSKVLRTSGAAMVQHIVQHVPNGLAFARGRLDYGNGEVYARFARAVRGEDGVLPGMSVDDALAVLKLQHEAGAALHNAWFR